MSPLTITTAEIENALHSGVLLFHYQPKISLVTGGISGAEALIRWRLPDGTLVPPGDFIPLAESSGLITDITAIMFHSLVEDIERIREVRDDISVSFNISGKDLHSPYLVKIIRSVIGGGRIDAHNLHLEITETAVVDSSARVEKHLQELVELGVKIVMDDYGIGFSSMDLLSRLPFSVIKLDQGIVSRMAHSPKNAYIARAFVLMAEDLRIHTVAEGIETQGAYNYLLSLGFGEGQGYWMSRPLPLDSFLELCGSGKRWFGSTYGQIFNSHLSHVRLRKSILDTLFCLNATKPDEWGTIPQLEHDIGDVESTVEDLLALANGEQSPPLDRERLGDLHSGFHETGGKLLKAAREGASRTVQKELLDDLHRHAEGLINLFREMEEAIAIETVPHEGG